MALADLQFIRQVGNTACPISSLPFHSAAANGATDFDVWQWRKSDNPDTGSNSSDFDSLIIKAPQATVAGATLFAKPILDKLERSTVLVMINPFYNKVFYVC